MPGANLAGPLAALGILISYIAFLHYAPDREIASRTFLSSLICGTLAGHFFTALATRGSLPWYAIFSGIVSIHAGIGATAGAIGYLLLRRLTPPEVMCYLNSIAHAFPAGWILVRSGCALAHDHLGIYAIGWFTVNSPTEPRYDLGLLELLWAVCMAVLFRFVRNSHFGILLLSNAVFRIAILPLRIEPAQWEVYFCAVTGACGIWSIWYTTHDH